MASPNLPVTIEDLKTLVTVSDAKAQLYIDSADAIVSARGISSNYTARTTYLIELYLAAHFSVLASMVGSNGNLTNIEVGNSRETYADPSKSLSGIANSGFGLQALALDTKGLLSEDAAKPLKALFRVV